MARLARPSRQSLDVLRIRDRFLLDDSRDGAGGVLCAHGRDFLGSGSLDAGNDPKRLLFFRHGSNLNSQPEESIWERGAAIGRGFEKPE
jgi:hypothetical protein